MDLRETGCEGGSWTELLQDRVLSGTLVTAVQNLLDALCGGAQCQCCAHLHLPTHSHNTAKCVHATMSICAG